MHIGIFGPTGCGKTYLAQGLAAHQSAQGFACLVCDPLGAAWPSASWQTTHAAALLAKAKAARNCRIFIEEASLSVGRDRDLSWFFTSSRHSGHLTHVIGQDGASLLPVMRQQLSTIYLFRCHPDLATIWARQFARPDIAEEAPTLAEFEFLICHTFKPLRRCKLSTP
jgi:hypothetical protein